jgi:Zn-dependent protease
MSLRINLMLAAFNLIPIDPLDYGKIFRGNPLV